MQRLSPQVRIFWGGGGVDLCVVFCLFVCLGGEGRVLPPSPLSSNKYSKKPCHDATQVHPFHEVVIVEGNYLLLKGVDPWDKAGGLFDEVWAIRCPPEVCGTSDMT